MLQFILLALSAVCATLPMCALLALVWWMDRYEREPLGLLAVAFLWGATGAIVLSLVSGTLISEGLSLTLWTGFATSEWGPYLGAVLIAPLTEEPSKALILAPLLFTRQFDNMTDGFVYGAAAGLGFGMVENFLYFSATTESVETWLATVFIRTLFSATGHAVVTSIVGACLGFAAFRGPLVIALSLGVGLFAAMVAHGIWNGLVSLTDYVNDPSFLGLGMVLALCQLLAAFVVFEICIWDEGRMVKRELLRESAEGVLPAEHAAILARWWRRGRSNWLPPHVDHHRYVELTTLLAMRLHQVRLMGRRARQRDKDEVDALRATIRALLKAP